MDDELESSKGTTKSDEEDTKEVLEDQDNTSEAPEEDASEAPKENASEAPEEDTSEAPEEATNKPSPSSPEESSETPKRRKNVEKPLEFFQVPTDVRKPVKESSSIESEGPKIQPPKMLQKPSRSGKLETVDDISLKKSKTERTRLKSVLKTSDSSRPQKRRRNSFVSFYTDQPSEEEDLTPIRRPSFVRRKLVDLEKELTVENIDKKETRIFPPKAPGEKTDKEKVVEGTQKLPTPTLSAGWAFIFLVSVTTGSALSSLPFFLMISSWFGVFLNLLLGFNALYAGLCTGWCWTILEERWPEYLEYTRIPYQEIAYRAVGTWMKYVVAVCVDLTILTSCAGYILFIGDSFEGMFGDKLHFCLILIIFTAFLLPFTMIGGYRNLKFVGVCDVTLSILFVLLLIVSFFLNKPHHGASNYADPSLGSSLMSFAGFSFAYGSGAVMPSIMSDMWDRRLFPHTVATSYMVCIVMYTILPIMGYAAYGDQTPRFIEQSVLSHGSRGLAIAISFIHIFQLCSSFIISILPTLHAFEVRVKCPDRFGLYRVIVRLSIVLGILLVVLGMPYIQKFLDFVGASVMNLCTFIFPPIFYVCLVYGKETKSKNRKISKKEWVLVAEIVVLGITAGTSALIMSFVNYRKSSPNRVSCYLNITV